jgi:hypothetical protein
VRQLESLILEIKSEGFDKIKEEINNKLNEKKTLEKNVETLTNSLKINNHHFNDLGALSTKLSQQNLLLMNCGEVCIIY